LKAFSWLKTRMDHHKRYFNDGVMYRHC
jgi:hypothetical protein